MDHTIETGNRQTSVNGDIPNLFRRFNADTSRGNYELYCREFSYCTIFGNLRTGNTHTILKLLDIKRLPNIMFLIQIDNSSGVYSQYPEFSFYPYKSSIVQALQIRLKKHKVESVVSRFLGYWTIGAYLFIEGKSIKDDETRLRVTALASDLSEYVSEKTGESISIGISDFCDSHAQFPRAYSECKTALSYVFFSGRQSISLFDCGKQTPGMTRKDLTRVFFANFIALLDKYDSSACDAVAYEMVDRFRKAEIPPLTTKLLVARMFGRITDYFTDAGVDQDSLACISQESFAELLECGFLDELTGIVVRFCDKISILHSSSRQSPDERFRRHVNDCIERNSSDCLFGLSAIASLSNYSPSYFSRLFTRMYGIPFSRYLAIYRIERAKRLLLHESMTLHEVSRKAGFCSTSYFCSVFRKVTGKSPRQYASETSAEMNEADAQEVYVQENKDTISNGVI